MKKIELKPGIYAVGAVDWNVRSFHGYTTNRGATYNAYLILDEKVTLIDTVKAPFAPELLARIREIIDPEKIDYVVSNHVEMDHSGAIPAVMAVAKNAVLVTSSPAGINGLKAHYGDSYQYLPVKAGDTISLGKRNLVFTGTPMLHWPDNMVTYCPEEKLLFSNDAFGQHFASSKLFDDENELSVVLEEAQKYYANILMPYGKQLQKTLPLIEGLEIEMIAPSHGVVWRSHVNEIIAKYQYYCKEEVEDKALVIYDSMWHSTEKLALSIAEGFAKKGTQTKLYDLKVNHISDIMTEVLKANYIAVGSPTLNSGMLPTVAGFLSYLKGLTPKNKKAFAFGSYGWGGQSIAMVEEALKACGYEIILDAVKVNYIPTEHQLKELENQIAEL